MPNSRILFLPDAGPDNPFQYLLVEELRRLGNDVYLGKKRSLFTLIITVCKYKPDLIYFDWVHSFLIGQQTVGSWIKSITFVIEVCIVKYLLRKKIIHTIHNIHSHAQKNLFIEKFFYKWFLKKCDLVRVYDESTISKINAYLGVKIQNYVVSADVPYTLRYKESVSKVEALKYLALKTERFTFLLIGNIKPYKGVEELVDTFRDNFFQNDTLIIAGRVQKGDFENLIKNKIEGASNILLVNEFIKEDDLKYYMAAADVAVFPFKNIEHSGSVELAMTFQKAIITTKVPSTLALLSHQEELLYEDKTELSDRMKKSKSMNLEVIGAKNRDVIASVNYKPLLHMFYV